MMKIKTRKKLYITDFIFGIVILSLVSFYLYRSYIFSETSIGTAKVYNITVRRHSVHYIEYEYFVNGTRYTGDEKINSLDDKKYFNRVFSVEISNKNPSWSKINLNKEIFDCKKSY